MQALTQTIFPCYAEADREIAAAVAAFLERGADVRVFLEDGLMLPGQDLAAKAREGRTADTVLVLFSRHSLPPRWPRAAWEEALMKEPAAEGVRIGFLRLDDCAAPRVLEPRFEIADLALEGLRALKRWVRRAPREASFTPRVPGSELDVELLGIALADRPGSDVAPSLELALDFADTFRSDFDAILRLDVGQRSMAALTGDLAAQLDLRLEGDVESNFQRLREFSMARRLLIILAGLEGQEGPAWDLLFGGRCSTLMIEGTSAAPAANDLLAAQAALRTAETAPVADWDQVCRLARLGRRLTRDAGRLAECHEMMQQWYRAAEKRGDLGAADEAAREMVWILEAWGQPEEAARLDYHRASETGEQMMLPFA